MKRPHGNPWAGGLCSAAAAQSLDIEPGKLRLFMSDDLCKNVCHAAVGCAKDLL